MAMETTLPPVSRGDVIHGMSLEMSQQIVPEGESNPRILLELQEPPAGNTGMTGALQSDIFPLNALAGSGTSDEHLVSPHPSVWRAGAALNIPQIRGRQEAPNPGRNPSALFTQLTSFTSPSLTDAEVLRQQTEFTQNSI